MTDLTRLAQALSDQDDEAPLPVDRWHPDHCGTMDLVIRADGTWWHEGRLMTRAPLVRLFSRILRKDPDGYVLVTPAEKIMITVEDVPFIAVDFDLDENGLTFRTNVGDRVRVDDRHPITLRRSDAIGQAAPYVLVRGGLEARVDRPAYYRLAEAFDMDEAAGGLVIASGNARYVLPFHAA